VEDFIKRMPINPNITIWDSLLTSYMIHNNAKLGEFVEEYLFELDPKNVGPYVLLLNIYATVGRWGNLQKLWKMMKKEGWKKHLDVVGFR
jgi:hypothetical protein